MSNNELTHWGIKGMRWGVRRYQNADGSLTPAGKKRRQQYDSSEPNRQARPSSRPSSGKRSVHELTDAELRERITRLELERRYKDLNPQKVSAGKRLVDKVIAPAATEAGKRLATDYLTKQGKKLLGLDDKSTGDTAAELKKEAERLKNLATIDMYKKKGFQ